jgi:hypothetical protein
MHPSAPWETGRASRPRRSEIDERERACRTDEDAAPSPSCRARGRGARVREREGGMGPRRRNHRAGFLVTGDAVEMGPCLVGGDPLRPGFLLYHWDMRCWMPLSDRGPRRALTRTRPVSAAVRTRCGGPG